MLGLKRRSKVEGWAMPVSENEDMDKSPLQRLADNNKLFVVCLLVVLLVSVFLLHQAKKGDKAINKMPPLRGLGAYDDEQHRQFAADFMREKPRGCTVLLARFTGEGRFMFVVPGDASADDIDYLALTSAQANLHNFKNRIVIQAYQRKAATKSDVLVAVTRWVPERFGFVTKFMDNGTKP